MIKNKALLDKIKTSMADALADTGLIVRGDFFVFDGTKVGWLIGNHGQIFWQFFTESPEYLQKHANPIDSYSERVITNIAQQLSTTFSLNHVMTSFPSMGPPYYPFQQWAVMAEQLKSSPLGLLMHPVYGLWHAYRGAILFDVTPAIYADAKEAVGKRLLPEHPCDNCQQKPCLSSCPVHAFGGGYRVSDCANYVIQQNNDCYQQGCIARLACPYAPEYRYQREHHCYHLHLFAKKRNTLGIDKSE